MKGNTEMNIKGLDSFKSLAADSTDLKEKANLINLKIKTNRQQGNTLRHELNDILKEIEKLKNKENKL